VNGSVTKVRPGSEWRRGQIVMAVVVATKQSVRRKDGMMASMGRNAAVLVNKKREPIGTRVLGLVGLEVRHRGQAKLVSRIQHTV
jgi:large subunit ribosomal protein L14